MRPVCSTMIGDASLVPGTQKPRQTRGLAQGTAKPETGFVRIEKVGFAMDSPLEERGFELVWGFSCQVVVFGLLQFFVRSGKGRSSSRRLRSGSRSARKGARDRNGSTAWRLAA